VQRRRGVGDPRSDSLPLDPLPRRGGAIELSGGNGAELTEQHSDAYARLAGRLGETPQPIPLVVSFAGTATLTTADARFPGPFVSDVTARATFNPLRSALTVDSLPRYQRHSRLA